MRLLDEFPFLVWRAGLDGKCDYFNKAWLDFTGRTLEEEMGDGWARGVHPEDVRACLHDYQEAFRARVAFQLQYRLRRFDGEFCWMVAHGSPFNDDAGMFAGYIGGCYDITERKKGEETLEKSERLFAIFMDNVPGFAWMKDLEGRYVYVNRMLEKLGPYRAAWQAKTDADLWPEETAAIFRANDEAVIATRRPLQTVEPYVLDGELRQSLVCKFPILGSSGTVEMVGGASIDVTERSQAEQAQAELAAIVESLGDAIIGKTLGGEIVSWNPAAERMYGYSAAEVIGCSITILVPPDRHDEIREILERVKRGEFIEPLETTHIRKDGSQILISLTISPIRNRRGEVTGASATAHNTTKQKRAEQALRESETRFRQIAENITDVFWIWTATPRNPSLLYVSPAYETIWGRSCESLYSSPQSWKEALQPQDKGWVLSEIAKADLERARDLTYRIVRPDRSIRWIRDRIFPVRDGSGTVVRVAGIAEDITEHKQAEEALRARELDLAEAQRVAKIGNWRFDLRRNLVTWSDELYRIFEAAKSELNGYESFLARVHPEDRELVFRANAQAREYGTEFQMEYRIITARGEVKTIREEGFASRDDQGNVEQLFGVAQDVTSRKRAEEALDMAKRQLQILSRHRVQVQEEERRRLSRELHDQIGQALTAAKICLRSAKRSKRRETVGRQLDDAVGIINGVLQLVRQMTLYLRPSVLDDLGLVAALRVVFDDYAQRAGWRAQFVGDPHLKRPDPEVETACFRIALEALTNIARHARARKVSIDLHRMGDSLHLIVRDDGVGFDVADAEKRIQRDRLGLVSMRERATVVGGRIEYRSAPTQGTEVHAFLPFNPA